MRTTHGIGIALSAALLAAAIAAPRAADNDGALASHALMALDGSTLRVADLRGEVVVVNFWATWCAPCKDEFPDLQKTWRMYRNRPFELVTVSISYPDEEKGVRRFLESQHATSRNMLSDTMDPYELMGAFDPEWNGSVPYSMIIAPGGKVLYRSSGRVNILETRRLILKSFPDDDYVGQNAYWNSK